MYKYLTFISLFLIFSSIVILLDYFSFEKEESVLNYSEYFYNFNNIIENVPNMAAGGGCYHEPCKLSNFEIEKMSKKSCVNGVIISKMWFKDMEPSIEFLNGEYYSKVIEIENTDTQNLFIRGENMSAKTCILNFSVFTNDFLVSPLHKIYKEELEPFTKKDINVGLVTPNKDKLGKAGILVSQSNFHRINHVSLSLETNIRFDGESSQSIERNKKYFNIIILVLQSVVFPSIVSYFTSLFLFYKKKSKKENKSRIITTPN